MYIYYVLTGCFNPAVCLISRCEASIYLMCDTLSHCLAHLTMIEDDTIWQVIM